MLPRESKQGVCVCYVRKVSRVCVCYLRKASRFECWSRSSRSRKVGLEGSDWLEQAPGRDVAARCNSMSFTVFTPRL